MLQLSHAAGLLREADAESRRDQFGERRLIDGPGMSTQADATVTSGSLRLSNASAEQAACD